MGTNLGSIYVLSSNLNTVAAAAGRARARLEFRGWILPTKDGRTTLLTEGFGQDLRISAELARELPERQVLHGVVHDSSLLIVHLYRNGALVDVFVSRPDYFGASGVEEGGPGHDPARYADWLSHPRRAAALRRLFAEPPQHEWDRLKTLARLLRLPAVTQTYEDLEPPPDGDDGASNRLLAKAEHVPPRGDRKAEARQRKLEARQRQQRLLSSGVLVEQQDYAEKARRERFAWLVEPAGAGILRLRSSPLDAPPPRQMQVSRWLNGVEEAMPQLVASVGESHFALSADARHLLSAEETTLRCRELATGELQEIDLGRRLDGVEWIAGQDFCLRSDEGTSCAISLYSTSSGQATPWRTLPGTRAGQYAFDLVRGLTYRIEASSVLVESSRGEIVRELDFSRPRLFSTDPAQLAAFDTLLAESALPPAPGEGLLAYSDRLARRAVELGVDFERVLGGQRPARVVVSRDGRWLVCGNEQQIAVYPLHEGLPPALDQPAAVATVRAEVERLFGISVPHQWLHDVQFDLARERVLFTGSGGGVQALDLRSGRTALLLESAERCFVRTVALTGDRRHLVCEHTSMRPVPNRPQQVWNYAALCAQAGLDW